MSANAIMLPLTGLIALGLIVWALRRRLKSIRDSRQVTHRAHVPGDDRDQAEIARSVLHGHGTSGQGH